MLAQNIMDNSKVPQQAGAAQQADFVPHTTVLSTAIPPFPPHPIQPYPFSSRYATLQSGLPPPLPVQLPQINMQLPMPAPVTSILPAPCPVAQPPSLPTMTISAPVPRTAATPSAAPLGAATFNPVLVAQPPMRKGTLINDDDRLALIKFCIEYNEENVYGNKKQFWQKMSLLLQQECGLLLRDPQSTVDDMVASRRIVLARQKKESGTVQQDTELLQALDVLVAIEDEKKKAREDLKKTAAEKEKEAQEASERRASLFKPVSQRKKREHEEQEEGENMIEMDSEYEVDSEEPLGNKRRRITDSSDKLMFALKDFGRGLERAIVRGAEINSGTRMIDELQTKIERQREEDLRIREEDRKEAEKSRNEMREMLAAVLLKLNK
ncbi:hypothetical protein BZA77DRAFT_67862 [Pyronema omphalodes]|nr:hypothetical protein BZA77DRAFT_67862 [Pyronema omphalodes]